MNQIHIETHSRFSENEKLGIIDVSPEVVSIILKL